MNLASVSGNLTQPWTLIEKELTDVFGSPRTDDTEYVWSVIVLQWFTLTTLADRATGDIKITVATRIPYTSLSTIAMGGTILVVFFAPSVELLFLVMTACLVLAHVPLLPGLVMFPQLYGTTSDFFSVEGFRISRVVLIPIAGWVVASLYIARPDSILLPEAIIALALIALFAFVSTTSLHELRGQPVILFLSVLSLLPLLVQLGNLVFINSWTEVLSPTLTVATIGVLLVGTLAGLVVYVFLCRTFVTWADHLPNQPIDSFLPRLGWAVLLLSLNGLLIALIVFGLSNQWTTVQFVSIQSLTVEFAQAGLPIPYFFAWISLVGLLLPVIGLVGLWVFHLYNEMRVRRALSKAAEYTVLESDIAVRLVESSHPQAYAHTTLRGEQVIIVTTGLRERLDDEELQAVIKHESYHLQHQDSLRTLIATVLGVFFGGKNAVVVLFNFPGIERNADLYAAERVGTGPLIRALRRLESATTATATNSPAFLTGPQFASQRVHGLSEQLIGPSYRVLFGNVIISSAHPTIDKRIEFISSETN